jgi:hypothetical protein
MRRKPGRAERAFDPAFEWTGGVRIAGTQIWCDAARRGRLCFLSHAKVKLAPRSQARVIATEATLAAMGRRRPSDALVAPLGRPFAIGRARLELLPSGIAPGAAQLLVELPERRVLYAGGGVAPSPTQYGQAQLRACDAIAVTPHGSDGAELVEYCAASGAKEAYLLGEPAPDVADALEARGLTVHRLAAPSQMRLFY